MNHPIVGAVSPDGNFYWDGARWIGAVSPDGGWRWNGVAWVAVARSPIESRPLTFYGPPQTLAICVTVLMGISVAVAAIEALFVRPYFVGTLTFGDRQVEYSVGIVGFLTLVISASFFVLWFWRSHQNLEALGAQELRFSSGWAIGWWFVPIVCFWAPYRAATEIWKASDPLATRTTFADSRRQVDPSLLIRFWWAAWLASVVLSNLVAVAVAPDQNGLNLLTLLSGAATALAAILTITVVWSITKRQAERWRLLAR